MLRRELSCLLGARRSPCTMAADQSRRLWVALRYTLCHSRVDEQRRLECGRLAASNLISRSAQCWLRQAHLRLLMY